VPVDQDSLKAIELETIQAIHRNPEATQREIADELGVARSTVCRRVNGIEGFEWSERAEFATALLDTPTSQSDTTEE
jgi:DNA-binding MarR family transcriptional regulator